MKRYIKSVNDERDETSALYDIISVGGMKVVFVDSFNSNIISAVYGSINPDYSTYTDDELKELDIEEIHKIKDTQTIIRIAKINRKLLSPAQKLITDKQFREKEILSKNIVKAILADLKTKHHAYFMPDNGENESFIEANDISTEDALYAVQHLTIGDYVSNTTNFLPQYYGDDLIIFEPTRALPLKNGNVLRNTIIYIKIDLDLSKKKGVYLISFHSTDHEDYKPYNDSK